jgi:hypothetical protein
MSATYQIEPRVGAADDESDIVWGAEAIGREINRTAEQIYYLHRSSALKGAVRKVGHRTYLASRRKLRELASNI